MHNTPATTRTAPNTTNSTGNPGTNPNTNANTAPDANANTAPPANTQPDNGALIQTPATEEAEKKAANAQAANAAVTVPGNANR